MCEKYGVFGVDSRYKLTVSKHVESGDLIFFYVKERKEFRGPYKVIEGGHYNPNHPAVKEWKSREGVRYEYIVPIRKLKDLVVRLDTIFDKLLFITNRKRGRGRYSDHFQFSIISIRSEDYETILKGGSPSLK